jgi:parvulin-like peptidyl-prolyl isomerase
MNRTNLIRTLSLGLASLALATASLAGTAQQDQLRAAYDMADTDANVAVELQAWLSQRDIAMLAQADGLITNDMRADAEQYAVAMIVEADGLVTAQLRDQVEMQVVARLAAADGLVVEGYDLAISSPESAPATRNPGAVLLAATGR